MMDRKQAIDTLRERGFFVQERKWVEGDTILVGALRDGDDIKVYRVAEYLMPGDSETWRVSDLQFRRNGDDKVFPTLAEAVDAITRFMREAIADVMRSDDELHRK